MKTGLSVENEIHRMLDQYVPEENLHRLIQTFIEDKKNENSAWAGLTRCVHYMLGGTSLAIERAAAITELFILLLDIVDDLQDRDQPDKPWMKSDPAVTLNALLALSAAVIGEIGRLVPGSLAAEVGALLACSVHGQQTDIAGDVRTEEDYLEMVERKSGSLLQFACLMGYSLVDGVTEQTRNALNELACCAGIVAQIENDMNDVLRFDLKNDLLQKKRTLPILYVLEDAAEECPELAGYYDGNLNLEDILPRKMDILAYIRDSGCLEYCRVIQTLYVDKARELYRTLPAKEPWGDRFMEQAFPQGFD